MTQKSSDQLLESLSALVDNEASELEVRRILKNVESNPEVRDRWRSYNLIGSVMRKEADLNLGGVLNISERVSSALINEQTFSEAPAVPKVAEATANPSVVSSSSSNRKGLFDFIAKSAVAASFAGALVVGFNILSPGQDLDAKSNSGPVVATATKRLVDPDLSAPAGFELPRLESRTVSSGVTNPTTVSPMLTSMRLQAFDPAQMDDISDPATQHLLNELLIHHAARASANGSLGMMPYARVSQMQQVGTSE